MHCDCQCLVLPCGFSDVSCRHRQCSYIHDLNCRCLFFRLLLCWGLGQSWQAVSTFVPGMYSIWYMYELKINAHSCILWAARVGTPWSWPKILHSGQWSVMRVNSLLYKYWWNFFTASKIANFSLFTCAKLDSAPVKVREANATGCSCPSTMCISHAPSPYGDASQ